MKKFVCLLLFTAFSSLYALEITPDKSDHIYKNGEKIVFNIQLDKGRENAAFTIQLQGNRYLVPSQTLTSDASGKAQLILPAERPGFIRVTVNDNGKSASAAVAVDKDAILPARERPERFDKYWNTVRSSLDLAPVQYKISEVKSSRQGFKTYEIMVVMPGEAAPPLYAVLTLPEHAVPGRLAAMVIFHDTGIDKAEPRYRSGALVLSVNPLPVKHDGEQGATMREGGAFYGYPFRGMDDAEKNVFLPMFKRAYRALQFIKTRPEWDRRTLIVAGTGQGGAQAVAAAGLDQDVSMCVALSPSLSNHGGYENGSESGWPHFHQDKNIYLADPDRTLALLDLLDICFFAQNIRKAEVCIFTGFKDQINPASSVFAFYNVIPSADKVIFAVPGSDRRMPPGTEKAIRRRISIHIRKQQTFR